MEIIDSEVYLFKYNTVMKKLEGNFPTLSYFSVLFLCSPYLFPQLRINLCFSFDSVVSSSVTQLNCPYRYDFALFGFFSDVIADVFFPPEEAGEEHDNLLKSFAIFGIAFLMRPIGGLVIGYMGDKHGRKTALTNSLFLMAIPTTLMGCLPVYETAGVLSPILLTLCRILQGISVGGQLPASLVYTVEKKDKSQWGYYGALPMVAANVGSLLGNLCGALFRQVLSDEQLQDWGWRIPFLSGFLIALVAWFIKRHGADVHTNAGVYDHQDSDMGQNPVKVAFRKGNRLAILSVTLTGILWAGGYYLSFVWMAIYMEDLLDPPIEHAFWINAVALFLSMTILLPVAGMISDRTGRVKLMTVAAIALAAGGPILFIMISTGNGFVAFLCQLALGVSLSFFGGPLCAWLVESFNPEIRLTSAALGYDLAHATAGGFAPALATLLFRAGDRAPGILYIIFGVLSLCGLYINYFCGSGNDIEETTGGTGGDLELQDSATKGKESTTANESMEEAAEKDLPAIS